MLKDHLPPPTDPELLSVLEELIKREPIFHRPEFGTTRADFEKMMSPDFWEIGASGRRYSRAFVLDELERRHAPKSSKNGKQANSIAENWLQMFFCLSIHFWKMALG